MKHCLKLFIATLLFIPCLAQAHEVAGGNGFMAGFNHPVLGLDHLLAMLGVGMLSAQMGGRAIWSIPTAFVIVMLVGGLLGIQGVPLFSVELGISISVLAMGIAIVVERKLPYLLALLFVGFFAIFHGYAHGLEIPYLAKPLYYVCGFIAGTATIHIVGVFIALFLKKLPQGYQLLKYLGAAIGGIGFYLIIS